MSIPVRRKTKAKEITVRYKEWRKADRTLVRIKGMDDHHLVAAILMCERTAQFRFDKQAEHNSRGQRKEIRPYESFVARQYEDLVFEARVRGIDLEATRLSPE